MEVLSQGNRITVKASRGRAIRLKVDANTADVILFVPKGVSLSRAISFADSKAEWISRARQSILKKLENQKINNTALLFGQKLLVQKTEGRCRIEDGVMYLKEGREQECADKLYRKELIEYLQERVPYYEKLTGLKSNGYKIRKMTSRWGSCNVVKRTLTFSLNLAKVPYIAVDYVILHEITHIKHANHGREFKALLASYMPDWKKRKNFLKGD